MKDFNKVILTKLQQNKSKIDYVDSKTGIVFGHINTFESKERLKKELDELKLFFPILEFKTFKTQKKIGNKYYYDLYADYYQYWSNEK